MSKGDEGITAGPTRRAMLAAGAAGTAGALLAPGAIVLAQADTGPRNRCGPLTPPPPSARPAAKAVTDVEPAILRISREVWECRAVAAGMKSHAIHIRELEAEGFTITSRNTSGYPTAFIAEWTQGTGGPVIAYLPEYDALPGLGNAAEPRQTPGPTGVEVGHACGHNLIGAGCTGAAFALKRMMQADGTAGTIRVYGCASEESQGVKVYMVRDGLFDDVDAALAWHPAPGRGDGGRAHGGQRRHPRHLPRANGPCRQLALGRALGARCGGTVRPCREPDARACAADRAHCTTSSRRPAWRRTWCRTSRRSG